MIFFWLVCIVFVGIALAFVLPPLLQRTAETEEGGVKEANVAVYRDQLRELEADMRNGIVSREQYEQDRDEIDRRLLEDVAASGAQTTKQTKTAITSRNFAYSLIVALPLVAVLFYLKVGNQNARSAAPANVTAESAPASAPQAGEMSADRIAANVATLAKRLEQNPSDAQGWAMLARSYSEMQNYKEASAAFEKATALNGNDANLLADYAYALAMARGQSMEGTPTELVNKALKLDPKNEKALVLAGNAAFKVKNYDQAIEYWGKLLKTAPPNSELMQSLTERISEAKRLAQDSTK